MQHTGILLEWRRGICSLHREVAQRDFHSHPMGSAFTVEETYILLFPSNILREVIDILTHKPYY